MLENGWCLKIIALLVMEFMIASVYYNENIIYDAYWDSWTVVPSSVVLRAF